MKRPKDMTPSELEALPVGPYKQIEEPITPEERKKGMMGRVKVRVVMPELGSVHFEEDDLLYWTDSKGNTWQFGQYADGTWFKQITFF